MSQEPEPSPAGQSGQPDPSESVGTVAQPPGLPLQRTIEPQLAAANAEAPEPRRRWGTVLGIAGGVAAVGAVAAIGFLAVSMLGEDLPVVGDCMTDSAAVADMAITDCDAADAYWLVVGHDGSWTHGEFESAQPGEVCARFPSTLQALWVSDQSTAAADTQGEVVCLEPLSNGE